METMMDSLMHIVTNEAEGNIHFIDIENLIGSGKCSATQVASVCEKYWKCVECTPSDLFVIAAGPQNRDAVFSGWKHGFKLVKFEKGKDGADHALRTVFKQIGNLEHFRKVYLASGDFGLAPIAQGATDRGIDFAVVTGRGTMSDRFINYKHIQIERS